MVRLTVCSEGCLRRDWQSLSVFSSVAVLCCPASRNAGFSRREAPRPTPRQPWCCRVSYQHSHRQEHKQPTTQKQGTLFNELICLLHWGFYCSLSGIYWRSRSFQPLGQTQGIHGGKTFRRSNSCMCKFTSLIIDLVTQQTYQELQWKSKMCIFEPGSL